MNSSILDGPLVSAFEGSTKGVVKQVLITYVVKDGMFRKETTTRQFNEDGSDWHDTSSTEPLIKVDK